MTDTKDISIAFHIGGPEPETNDLLRLLRKSASELNDRGVMVRRPVKYLGGISELIEMQAADTLTPEDQEAFIASNTKGKDVTRLVMSDPNFLGTGLDVLDVGNAKVSPGQKVLALKQALGVRTCEIFIGICHPASLLSTEFREQHGDWDSFVANIQLSMLRWSFVVQDILERAPDTPVHVWCVEDMTPALPKLFRAITGLDDTLALYGQLETLKEILPSEAYDSLKSFLAERPNLTEAQRREVCTSFYARFVPEEDTPVEIDLPGCTQDQMDILLSNYEKDVEALRKMPGVTFID